MMTERSKVEDGKVDERGSSPEVLKGHDLAVVDLRADWPRAVEIIRNNTEVQKEMDSAYASWQEDYPDAGDEKWSYAKIEEGFLPCNLTTSDWLFEYEHEEWEIQASEAEKYAMCLLWEALEALDHVEGSDDAAERVFYAQLDLQFMHPPRLSQPETWRPQHACHYVTPWVRALAEKLYSDLASDWRVIASEAHSVVAGFADDGTVHLVDLCLLPETPEKVLEALDATLLQSTETHINEV